MKNKGNATITGILVVVVTLMIGAVIMQSLDDAFSGILGIGTTYNSVYNSTSDNGVTGVNLMALLPILLGAGILIGAVYSFANRA